MEIRETAKGHVSRCTVKTLPQSEIGLPGSCDLHVAKRITPDVDGDGRGDALFRLEWVVAGDGTLPRCRGTFRGEGYRIVVFILAQSGGAPASCLAGFGS